jgi:hypothetical protein
VDVAVTGPGGPQVGSAAQEAARLFAAVEDWARTRGEALAADGGHPGAATCGVCPVCTGIALLRDVRPETVEHLLDAAASVVAAVRSAVVVPPAPDGARPPGGVEHIDVREG